MHMARLRVEWIPDHDPENIQTADSDVILNASSSKTAFMAVKRIFQDRICQFGNVHLTIQLENELDSKYVKVKILKVSILCNKFNVIFLQIIFGFRISLIKLFYLKIIISILSSSLTVKCF